MYGICRSSGLFEAARATDELGAFKGVALAILLGVAMWFGVISYAISQELQPATPMAVVTVADLNDLNEIIAKEIPTRWSKPLADWLNKLIQRKAVEDKKVAAESKPSDTNK